MPGSDAPERLSLVAETLAVATRSVERGRVVVRTLIDEREEMAEIDLRYDEVSVERVPIGREVDTAPAVREADGILIVPVLEEEVVVRTRLMLKEEIRIVRRSRVENFRQPVRLRSERAEVVRQDPSHPDRPNPEGDAK